MIPKIIHYCWFGGGEKPKKAIKCMESWKKFCPDYEFREWNETTFDVNMNGYTKMCYEQKKYAFLSDFVRLVVVEKYGGLYFDTDVELVKRPDELLGYKAFYGFENDENINTGEGFGAEAGHATVKAMIDEYLAIVPDEDGMYPLKACPALNTAALLPFGLKTDGMRQNVAGAEILPADFLNPYDDPTGQLNMTENTISVHWYSKTWMSKWTILRSKLTKPLHRLFGTHFFRRKR